MIKYYCDKCEKELSKDDYGKCEIRIRGFSFMTDTFSASYCDDCLSQIIGADNYAEMKKRKAERKKRVEEAKAERRAKIETLATEKGGVE